MFTMTRGSRLSSIFVLVIAWTKHMINKTALWKMGTKITVIFIIRKKLLEFLEQLMKKEGLENLNSKTLMNIKKAVEYSD